LFDENLEKIVNFIINKSGLNNIIIETNQYIICITDRISSSSIFYCIEGEKLIISNSSKKIANCLRKPKIDSVSKLEILTAGYALSKKTIICGLHRVEAGNFLLFKKKNNSFNIHSYFDYKLKKVNNKKIGDVIEELDNINKNVFKDIIAKAAGRKILIPLSGGLDSRHVLTSLLQLNYQNIETFSYGVYGNYDAINARKIAKHLKVKWQMIPSDFKAFENFYKQEERKNYWDFADDLIMAPNLFSFLAIKEISKQYPEEILIINGNAGDFLTGNHIPTLNMDKKYSSQEFLNVIIMKHFSHNKKLLSTENLKRLNQSVLEKEFLNIESRFNFNDFARHYEHWEWSERQSKRVVNAQKVYEYFDLNWELPLWDFRLINFWINQPLINKVGRNLFIKYLQLTDSYGVYADNKIKEVSIWTSKTHYLTYIGKILRVIFGSRVSGNFYEFFKTHTKYGFMYGGIDRKYYLSNYKSFRDPLSFWSEDWIKNKLEMYKE
jgi:asparagine synthase (glutamine-hydrolysing)